MWVEGRLPTCAVVTDKKCETTNIMIWLFTERRKTNIALPYLSMQPHFPSAAHQAALDPDGASEDVGDSAGDQDGSNLMSELMGEVSVPSFVSCLLQFLSIIVLSSNGYTALAASSNMSEP